MLWISPPTTVRSPNLRSTQRNKYTGDKTTEKGVVVVVVVVRYIMHFSEVEASEGVTNIYYFFHLTFGT
jgi:hypothetical protein